MLVYVYMGTHDVAGDYEGSRCECQPRSPFKLLAYASISVIVCYMLLLITTEFFVDEPDGLFQIGDGFFCSLTDYAFLACISVCMVVCSCYVHSAIDSLIPRP